ncbi:2Fe-2S iron-sulfur cluster-binding protein [Hydrogenophaga sp.]|uniref:2Fe-2S iron-sulfur cluster-binding protein n=1 Tax=Hydrogenophaga sp. TaxID=1904254 RepID=UPI002626EC71|nr:2Fe-2S iron-sulfur cluster-binding protein [Hydrogenophaga sp.]MCW5653025.1 2Fe-2S iron-sulfur cluster binding domain-containing protein [Hydrogenophaga sp.]
MSQLNNDELPRIDATDREGVSHALSWEPDQSLMEVLRDNGLPLLASCGGCCSCATCHVHVDPEWLDRLPPRGQDELDLLSETGAFDPVRSRLSCQIPFDASLAGLRVTLAADD